ncbi:MAG TPA: bifunctional 5,10-methylenetetrahydrofolate dehydrogenase/5,10-methenyltetrahydrofolate cyclohydrolase [Candidatus Paceibacterota bacterium]
MKILDGRKAREHYIYILKNRIDKLAFKPCLTIIQIGSRADSDSFISAKKSFAQKMNIKEIHEKMPENVTQEEVIKIIKKYNKDKSVNGIIVQLPLPKHLDAGEIINNIDNKKDVDGLTSKTKFTPATARGIKELLDFYKINLKNKKVTVLGQSDLVGKPVSEMCRKEGAIVTVCDSKTEDVPKKTKKADIIIVAIGKPKSINENYIKKDQIVIDVGITREGEKLYGDVDFERVKDIASAITPVPGGVGQMTVLALFENLIDACYNENI